MHMADHPTEYCAAPYQTAVKVPEGLSFTEAAGLSWSFIEMMVAQDLRHVYLFDLQWKYF